jgi:hypothetical protein
MAQWLVSWLGIRKRLVMKRYTFPPTSTGDRRMFRVSFAVLLLLLSPVVPAFAQSQAANGAIEGIASDSSGAVLPGVSVTLTNTDTGAMRSVVTNESGIYRAPLLPLGVYRIVAELPGFRRFEQAGVRLSVGQTVVINPSLSVGALSESVTVNAADAPALELGRIDVGHTMSEVEVKSLPLVARNPYNFALVQPGVTGTENVEFGVPRLAANGASMRINYQIDGNTNTQKDRAGLRLLPMSEVMIQEIKVVTTGFAPEFGQTMGMVYNAVTPSGTNTFHGEGSYLFRRKDFSAYPFYFTQPKTEANKPETKVDTGTAAAGGPVLRNRLFFYSGWEQTRRDLSSNNLITILPDNAAVLGLKPQPAAVPNVQTAKFFIAKSDYQLNTANRATVRFLRFANDAPYNSGGGINSLERATDFIDSMTSTSGQLVSTVGTSMLNEARVQYAQRHQSSVANSDSGTGPSILIAGIAGFGSPLSGTGQGNAGFDFKQNITQVIDNVTILRSTHSYKFGIDWQHIYDERTAAPQFLYNFPSIAAYQAARSGSNPFGYSTMTQITGNLSFDMTTNLYSAFVQDDWQLTPSVKVLYGLRYDLYAYPAGAADAPLASSRDFNIDKNNWGPRAGVAWAVSPRTVVRGSMGIMYDQPLLGSYEQALQVSGSPRAPLYTFNGTQAGAPAFPAAASGGTIAQQSPWTVDPEFQTARTWQSSVQVERALASDMTASASLMYAKGYQLPVVTDTNLINPTGTLSDGRPIYSTAVNASTRLDPRFNHINSVQSIGESTFKSMTLQVSKRFRQGLTFNVQYSLGKGVDNTPLLTQLTVQAETGGRSDPSNLDRDEGPNPLDMRHNFTGDLVYTSSNSADNAIVRGLLNGNQLGVLLQFNSGLPINLLSNRDLNGDGALSDRPIGIGRNSFYLPVRKNVDLRYTRWIPIRGELRGEVVAELKNVFNIEQLQTFTASGIVVDAAGNPVNPIPDDPSQFAGRTGFEQRKFQLGFRLRF